MSASNCARVILRSPIVSTTASAATLTAGGGSVAGMGAGCGVPGMGLAVPGSGGCGPGGCGGGVWADATVSALRIKTVEIVKAFMGIGLLNGPEDTRRVRIRIYV